MVQPERGEGLNKEEEEVQVITKEDVEALKKELTEAKTEVQANLASWQRVQADFINYRRRIEQEKEETVKFANAGLALSLLPIIDDFERAFASLPPEPNGVAWVEGIRLIERKMRTALEAHGLSTIEAVGQPFDPRLHEAMRQDKGKEGIIVQEMQKGYRIHGKVIRPSKVVVGNGEEIEAESQNDALL
jgi:molecular chaperone GrpE